MKVIILTGSVGTGKTTIAKKLSDKLGYKYLDVKRILSKHNLIDGIDKERKSKIIDINKLNNALIKEIKEIKQNKNLGLIIDSHLSHYLPKKHVDLCIVTRCNLKTLQQRLIKRKYNQNKIRENLDTEIFEICLNEAIENKHNIIQVDTTKRININKLIKEIRSKL